MNSTQNSNFYTNSSEEKCLLASFHISNYIHGMEQKKVSEGQSIDFIELDQSWECTQKIQRDLANKGWKLKKTKNKNHYQDFEVHRDAKTITFKAAHINRENECIQSFATIKKLREEKGVSNLNRRVMNFKGNKARLNPKLSYQSFDDPLNLDSRWKCFQDAVETINSKQPLGDDLWETKVIIKNKNAHGDTETITDFNLDVENDEITFYSRYALEKEKPIRSLYSRMTYKPKNREIEEVEEIIIDGINKEKEKKPQQNLLSIKFPETFASQLKRTHINPNEFFYKKSKDILKASPNRSNSVKRFNIAAYRDSFITCPSPLPIISDEKVNLKDYQLLINKAKNSDFDAVIKREETFYSRLKLIEELQLKILSKQKDDRIPELSYTKKQLKIALKGKANVGRVPLTFLCRENGIEKWKQFCKEVGQVFLDFNITDVTVQIIGSAVSGFSENPRKEIHSWGQKSDVDIIIFSTQMAVESAIKGVQINQKTVREGDFSCYKNTKEASKDGIGFYDTQIGKKLYLLGEKWSQILYGNNKTEETSLEFKLSILPDPYSENRAITIFRSEKKYLPFDIWFKSMCNQECIHKILKIV